MTLLALGASVVITRCVTIRHMPRPFSDGGEPSYGFPLPAFGWGGASSGEWDLALVPLGVDLLTALVACVLVARLVAHVLPAGAVLILGIVAALGASATEFEAALKLATGANHGRLWALGAGADDSCRTVWFGEPTPTMDWTDTDDPCVRAALAELRSE